MPEILVNGVGTIGKRVASAIQKQDDMTLKGVADVAPTAELRTLMSGESPVETDLYASTRDGKEELEDAGFEVEAVLEDVIEEVDLVVDATPSGVDEKNRENLYRPHDVKAIFQGGADPSIAPVQFNANANYDEARGEQFVQVVSCNTTSLCRTLHAVDEEFGVEQVTANLVRRGGDPKQDSRGPINSIIPVSEVPSHHGLDVQEVMPDLDITTLAVKVPTTLSHVHMVNVDLEEGVTEEEARRLFEDTERVTLESAGEGYSSTAKIIEKMRDLEKPRYDMHPAAVWEETITVQDGTLYWVHMVHQESIVVPDNIDAIRSMLEMAEKEESMEKTNDALGIGW
ncbi:MAG: type II glyceraldehyde-3-phosphate dehydrogenase [Candidatus Nanohaloarchaea archaeon]|nr:type II glyceraldehyde-3-phosphate dehydrogenase [Candidatus Nanohaloarchaea archaeon]